MGGWLEGGYACGMLSQRRDRIQGRTDLGWPPTLQWQVRAGARGEREGRRAAPGRHCHLRRLKSCSPQRSPPAGGRWSAIPPAPCGTAPGVAGETAAEPPADEPLCCHHPPHSPPLPPHRPEVTRQGSNSAGTLHGLKHTYTSTQIYAQHSHHCHNNIYRTLTWQCQTDSRTSRTGPSIRYFCPCDQQRFVVFVVGCNRRGRGWYPGTHPRDKSLQVKTPPTLIWLTIVHSHIYTHTHLQTFKTWHWFLQNNNFSYTLHSCWFNILDATITLHISFLQYKHTFWVMKLEMTEFRLLSFICYVVYIKLWETSKSTIILI